MQAAGLRLAPHTLAPSGSSGFFLHWGLLPAADSLCVSWFCGPCCAASWVLLIQRLSRDVATPESYKFSLRLEAGPARLWPTSFFSKRWHSLATSREPRGTQCGAGLHT